MSEAEAAAEKNYRRELAKFAEMPISTPPGEFFAQYLKVKAAHDNFWLEQMRRVGREQQAERRARTIETAPKSLPPETRAEIADKRRKRP